MSLIEGGRLLVGGVVAKPPAAVLLDVEARAEWLDGFVDEHMLDRLATRAAEHLPGVRVRIDDGELIAFDAWARRVARIAATHATVRTGDRIAGNFFAAGEHWTRLAEAIADDDDWRSRLPTLGFTVPSRRAWTRAGSRMPSAPVAGCGSTARSSSRTRCELTCAMSRSCSSRLGHAARGAVRPRAWARRFAGALRITSLEVPMPCRWAQSTDAETLALAWSLAVTAYAQLTCVPVRGVSRARHALVRRRIRSPSGPAHARPHGRRAQVCPPGFTTCGHTARYLASYVAGHRRRLQPHQSHSAEAAANAAAVGIRLRPNETWVQPHVRGLPSDAVLHFAWRGPAWLNARDS